MESMEPNPAFDPESYTEVLAAFDSIEDPRVLVWGGDWCPDTRQELPDLAATLEATGIPADRIEVIEVDREKQGPKVEAYGIEHIPAVVIEDGGEEVARFIESEDVPAPVFLAAQLDGSDLSHY
jgi:thiol-disulfide isomerase/thioredoxin